MQAATRPQHSAAFAPYRHLRKAGEHTWPGWGNWVYGRRPVHLASQYRRPALSRRYGRQPDPDPGRHLTPPAGLLWLSLSRKLEPGCHDQTPAGGVEIPGSTHRPNLTQLSPSRCVETTPPKPGVKGPKKGLLDWTSRAGARAGTGDRLGRARLTARDPEYLAPRLWQWEQSVGWIKR